MTVEAAACVTVSAGAVEASGAGVVTKASVAGGVVTDAGSTVVVSV